MASRTCRRAATDERLWMAICRADPICALAHAFERDADLRGTTSAWVLDARRHYAFPTADTLAHAPRGWRAFFGDRCSYARVAALLRQTQDTWFYDAQAVLKDHCARNPSYFTHPIPGPLCLELSVPDPLVAALVHAQLLEDGTLETAGARHRVLFFIAKSTADYEALNNLTVQYHAFRTVCMYIYLAPIT